MKLPALLELEKVLMKEVVKRRGLGGYSADADGILFLTESLFKLTQHLVDEFPQEEEQPKKKAK